MTENRQFAVGLRMLAGLIALAAVLGLSACGGGSGAPNNVFNTPGALSFVPNPLTAYSETPATLTIIGGQPPYSVFSSDQSTLPVQKNVIGNTVTLIPDVVSVSTSVTFTTVDAIGATAQGAITIQPSPLIQSLKLKADAYVGGCPNAGGSATPTDDQSDTFICGGQTGTVAVRIANVSGGGLVGRQVRFDVIQGAFQLNTELPGQPTTFALTYTVPTDQNGNAVARLRAIPNASAQVAIVQATDVATGAFVRGVFVIVPVTNANAADLVVVPTTVDIKGPDNLTCSSGAQATYYIFGGLPPYTVVAGFPGTVLLSPSVVQTSGAGFTVTTEGACVNPETFAITDSAGHTTTVTLTNEPGTAAPPSFTTNVPIILTPSSIATALACGTSVSITATGGGTVTTQGNTQTTSPATFFASTSRPDILSAVVVTHTPGATITLTRLRPAAATPPVTDSSTTPLTVTISDGNTIKTVSVPVATACTGPVGT